MTTRSRLASNDSEYRYFNSKFPYNDTNYFLNWSQTLASSSVNETVNTTTGLTSADMGNPTTITLFISATNGTAYTFSIYLSPDGINFYEYNAALATPTTGSLVTQIPGAQFIKIVGAANYSGNNLNIQIIANY